MQILAQISTLPLQGLASRGVKAVLVAALLLSPASAALAETRLASIFQDNMVLQREKPAPVWGWAEPGAKVEVRFAGQTRQAVADDKGAWKVVLGPLKASRDPQTLDVQAGGDAIHLKNVLVGEVWITAGQSNLCAGGKDVDMGVYPHYVSPGTKGGKPEVRMIAYGSGVALEPQSDSAKGARRGDAGSWHALAEDPPPAVMNIPEYAARVIRDGVDVPVGIVHVAVPGTNQAAWMSRQTLEKFPGAGGKANFYEEFLASCQEKLAASGGKYKTWEEYMKAAAAWQADKKGPDPLRNVLNLANFPTALYNTRVYPLAPLAVRGVMWHQGEAGPGGPYGQRLVAMVRQWRELFGQDFYFLWGTLGRHTASPPPLSPLRDSFYRAGTNVGIRNAAGLFGPEGKASLVEFYDLGDNVTHFEAKAEAGRRMGLAALTEVYGQTHVYTGPRMTEAKIEGAKATIRFTHVGDGLVYGPSINGISGVYLSGKGGTRWAQVKVVDANTIEVSHPDISDIQSVAYGDNSNPHETLFNSARLPASPFVVNPLAGKDPAESVPLLTLVGAGKGVRQVAHVRRDGYVFEVTPAESAKDAAHEPRKVQAYIPAEWKGYEVESGGKPVSVEETTKDGAKFVTFETTVGGGWVIVAEKGKADSFRKVHRP